MNIHRQIFSLASIFFLSMAQLNGMRSGLAHRLYHDSHSSIHLVPQDKESRTLIGLEPLFKKQEYRVDTDLITILEKELRAQSIDESDIKKQLASLHPSLFLTCEKFNQNTNQFDQHSVPADAPSIVAYKNVNFEKKIVLMQCYSLNQFDLAKQAGLSPALCAGHALYNAYCMQEYAKNGQVEHLNDMHHIHKGVDFLLNLDLTAAWITVPAIKEQIAKMKDHRYVRTNSSISAVSSLELFDSQLPNKRHFDAIIEINEYQYAQKVKEIITQGLKQKNFFHTIIVGNEESALEHGHFFNLSIVKHGEHTQYVVVDTMPNVYHLEEGSHEKCRLNNFVENIECGSSSNGIVNIKAYLLSLT